MTPLRTPEEWVQMFRLAGPPNIAGAIRHIQDQALAHMRERCAREILPFSGKLVAIIRALPLREDA